MLVRRQTSVVIVRRAEILLVDAAWEPSKPRRLSIRRRVGDRRERAGGRAEDRRHRFTAGYRGRHAEGGLGVAGCALDYGAVRLARSGRRVLFSRQYLYEVVAGLQGITGQQGALVVHGNGDPPGAGLLEGPGSTIAVSQPAADRVVPVDCGFDWSSHRLLLVRFVLRRDHRKLRAR